MVLPFFGDLYGEVAQRIGIAQHERNSHAHSWMLLVELLSFFAPRAEKQTVACRLSTLPWEHNKANSKELPWASKPQTLNIK